MGTVTIVDGHAIAYRAYHAVPDTLRAPDGRPVAVVHGFFTMLGRILTGAGPVVVVFDAGRDVRRTALFPAYKSGRSEAPATLRPQVDLVKEVLDLLDVPHVAVEGVEADDVIATVARAAVEQDMQVDIVSGDRDLLQLADDRVTLLLPGRSFKDVVRMTPEVVFERFGVHPAQYAEFAALRGDSSDGIPGVPGVGPKTAAAFLARYGSLDGLRAHIPEVTPVRFRKSLADAWPQVELNLMLTRTVDTVALPRPAEDLLAARALDRSSASAELRALGLHQAADLFGLL